MFVIGGRRFDTASHRQLEFDPRMLRRGCARQSIDRIPCDAVTWWPKLREIHDPLHRARSPRRDVYVRLAASITIDRCPCAHTPQRVALLYSPCASVMLRATRSRSSSSARRSSRGWPARVRRGWIVRRLRRQALRRTPCNTPALLSASTPRFPKDAEPRETTAFRTHCDRHPPDGCRRR